MSQLSDSVKAKRQARKTDADRALKQEHGKGQGTRKARNDAKKANLASQGSDVNFDTYGKGHVSGKEVQAMKDSGMSAADIQSKVSASGSEVGGRAQKKLDRYAKRASAKERANGQPAAPAPNNNAAPAPAPAPSPTPAPTPAPATPPAVTEQKVEVHQEQNQNANQDNDINSNINGDNNNVNINQDNSIRQYGGNVKSFVYNSNGGNGNNYNDTPVSAATMAGFYHDEDSPGKSASFVDRYQTMNADAQKKYANPNHAQNAINMAASNKSIDVNALDQRIADRAEATRARSTAMAGDIFGDMWNHTPKDYNTDYGDDDDD